MFWEHGSQDKISNTKYKDVRKRRMVNGQAENDKFLKLIDTSESWVNNETWINMFKVDAFSWWWELMINRCVYKQKIIFGDHWNNSFKIPNISKFFLGALKQ